MSATDRPDNSADARKVVDHAARAADHVLALVVAQDPGQRVTAQRHDAVVDLVHAIVSALVVGGAE